MTNRFSNFLGLINSVFFLLLLTALCCISSFVFAEDDSLCALFKLPNCDSLSSTSRRSSGKSLPSSVAASQFNPANVSHDRGVGVEVFYQKNNHLSAGFVTGTGQAGAALISAKNDNSFFGNKIVELDDDYLQRRLGKKQYSSNKYSLALGYGLISNTDMGIDLGLITKYNEDIKVVNFGGGLAIRLGPFSFGASMYKDDVFLNFGNKIDFRTHEFYVSEYNRLQYQENFDVQTFSVGVKRKNLFLDWGRIKTFYKFYNNKINIDIYSMSYIWKKLLFNVAVRNESNPALKFKEGKLVDQKYETSYYGGIQFSLNNYFIVGAHYNYFLLNEYSGSLSVFF